MSRSRTQHGASCEFQGMCFQITHLTLKVSIMTEADDKFMIPIIVFG